MNRMSCAEDGDTLPILQISSWGQAPLELSEFKEASISPARDILLLVSHQRQALLLPLAADSTEQVIPDTYFPPSQPASPNDNIQNAFEQKFFTPLASRQKIPSIPRSASKSAYNGADSPPDTPFYTPFSTPLRNSSPLYETPSYESPSGNGEGSFCFPAIPDARSLAWGCFGDECGYAKDAGVFKQLLFVSGERGVTVHAFCRKQMTDVRQDAPSEADGGLPKARNEVGRFVNWGPDGVSLEGCFADVAHAVAGSFREEVGSTGGVGERDDGFYGGRVGSTVPNMSSTSQKWLRSFFVDIELEESGGNLIAMFPAKSSIPSSAEVVSFCFSCNSPAFLRFIRSKGQVTSHDKDDSKVTSASIRQDKLLATESVQPDSCLGSENFLLPNQLEQDSCNGVNSPYECSKLFSSRSHRLVGMVLTRQFCVSEAAEEELSKSELELFVVVAVLHVSGISWVSTVDLQNLASSRLPRDAWVEFQLADEVLFGLKESGIIFMWAALTGKLMGCIDVLYHCGLELDLHTFEEERIEQPKRVQEDEMEYTVTSGVKRESTSEGVGKLQNVQMSRKTAPVHGLRIANVASLTSLNFLIQGHNLTVVEADSNYVEPFVVEDLNVYPGETYSVLITANQNPSRNYWIAVNVRGSGASKTPTGRAILRYIPNPPSMLPPSTPPKGPLWNDTAYTLNQAKQYRGRGHVMPPPLTPHKRIVLLSTQNRINGYIRWAINNISSVRPQTPYLIAVKYGLNKAFDRFPAPENYSITESNSNARYGNPVYRLEFNSTVDVILQNGKKLDGTSEIHPWHFHGHDFWVLAQGNGTFDPLKDTEKFNLRNPPKKNTVPLFPLGWTAIRFIADNPGVWTLHCHIEAHFFLGMGVVFEEGAQKIGRLPRSIMGCGGSKALLRH